MKRIALFLATNLAIVAIASITLNLLGVDHYLQNNGVDLNLTSLLIFCAVFGFAGSFVSLLLSKWLAKKGTGTQIIKQPRNNDEQWLISTVADLAKKAGIKTPEVGIFPAQESNAFATGWNRNDALVAVSQGLLQRFPKNEVRAVLAHEIGHVANGDMVTLALIQGVINTFVMFFARVIGHTVDRVVFKTERGHGIGFYIVTFVCEMVLGILASLIVMAFSRYREYRADHAGATLADRGSMIAALQRLQSESLQRTAMPDSLEAFAINGALKSAWFASHPPIAERIKALQAAR